MKQNLSQNRKRFSFLATGERHQSLCSTCPRCGGEVELWSAAEETRCLACNQKLYRRESTIH